MTSTIEWTNRHDWNPVRGCSRVSPGCGGPGPFGGCYAENMAARFSKPGQWGHGFAEMQGGKPRWTGKVALQEDRLTAPLRWAKGVPGKNKCFITTTSDPFHENLPDEAIDRLFAVMALRPDWIFQVLTKRSDRMREYYSGTAWVGRVMQAIKSLDSDHKPGCGGLIKLENGSLPNVWLGVSVEDQQRANERIPDLLTTPAAVRFISAEPLLGPVDLTDFCTGHYFTNALTGARWHDAPEGVASTSDKAGAKLDQVIVGGESGPHHRDNNFEANARSLLAQCRATGTAFFGKQNTGKRALPTDLQIREFPA